MNVAATPKTSVIERLLDLRSTLFQADDTAARVEKNLDMCPPTDQGKASEVRESIPALMSQIEEIATGLNGRLQRIEVAQGQFPSLQKAQCGQTR